VVWRTETAWHAVAASLQLDHTENPGGVHLLSRISHVIGHLF
jgi:hypothetical protein